MELLTVLFWTLVGSVFSLVGGIALLGHKKLRDGAIRYGFIITNRITMTKCMAGATRHTKP